MNTITRINLRKPAVAGFLMLLFVFNTNVFSQDGWFFGSSVQLSGGQFLSDSYSRIYSIYGSLRYQTDDFGITASIPVVKSSGNNVSQTNGLIISSGMGSVSSQNNSFGIGDLYSFFDYKIYSNFENDVDVYLNAQIKIPTSSPTMNFGTGEIDYGGSISARKMFGSFIAIAELGYLNIGDPDSINYKNPLTYGIGLGKFFNYGEFSLLIYYYGYTKILTDYEAPKQLSLGVNYKITDDIILSFIGSAGLGNLMPDYTMSTGIRIKL